MPYEIIISPRALKDLKNLPKDVTARIVSPLNKSRMTRSIPCTRLKTLLFIRFHVGEYRVILDILHQKLMILVVRVGHRRNIYKKI